MSLLSLTLVLAFTMPTAATPLATSVVLTMKAEYFRDGEWVSEPGENMEASGAWFRANLVESVSARTHAVDVRACASTRARHAHACACALTTAMIARATTQHVHRAIISFVFWRSRTLNSFTDIAMQPFATHAAAFCNDSGWSGQSRSTHSHSHARDTSLRSCATQPFTTQLQ
jgi:hypothetical protein